MQISSCIFEHPANIILAGPSQSGEFELLSILLRVCPLWCERGVLSIKIYFNYFYSLGKSTFMQNLFQHRFDLVRNCPSKSYLFYNQFIQKKYQPFIDSGELVAYEVSKIKYFFS